MVSGLKDINYKFQSPPNPTLLGHDLKKLYYGSSTLASLTSAYIVLLISDWGGDCRSVRGKLFASLREHDYNKETFEVRF